MTQLLSPFVGETRFSIQLAERVRAQSASVSCARVRTAMQLAALRLKKNAMDEAQYEAQLERLLTDLALKTKAIRDLQAQKEKR